MRRITALHLFATLVIGCATASSARAADPVRVGLKVLGDTSVTAPLRACLESALSHRPGLVLVDLLPAYELDVVLDTDVNDNVNPAGVSLAIAFVDHANAIILAKALLGGAQPTADPKVRDAVVALFASGGSLERLNVAHIGKPNAPATETICGRIAEDFVRKVPTAG